MRFSFGSALFCSQGACEGCVCCTMAPRLIPLNDFFSVLNPISFFACPGPDSHLEFTILDRAQYIFHPGHLLAECEAFCLSFSRGEIMLPFFSKLLSVYCF